MALPIAQNMPGMEWIPVIYLVIAIGVACFIVWILIQLRRASRRLGNWAIAISVLALAALIVYELWAWHMRTNTLEAVDSVSGAAIPIQCDLDTHSDLGDPTDEGSFSFGPESTPDGQLNYKHWRFSWNAPLPLIITSQGYEKASMILNDRSPTTLLFTSQDH